MPTYVYGCDTCGHRFEIVQKFQDSPLTECPSCGARIRRIFQPAGIVFKGSGWYSTDSRSNTAGAKAEASEGGASGAQEVASNGDNKAATPADAQGSPTPKSAPKTESAATAKTDT